MNAPVVIPRGQIDRHDYRDWLRKLVTVLEFPPIGSRKAPLKSMRKYEYETEMYR